MRKPVFCICENKDQLRGNRFIDSTMLLFFNPKFEASNHLLWLYSPVCVRPGRKQGYKFWFSYKRDAPITKLEETN